MDLLIREAQAEISVPSDSWSYKWRVARRAMMCISIMSPPGRVLLTGASGFIAAHVLDQLLRKG